MLLDARDRLPCSCFRHSRIQEDLPQIQGSDASIAQQDAAVTRMDDDGGGGRQDLCLSPPAASDGDADIACVCARALVMED